MHLFSHPVVAPCAASDTSTALSPPAKLYV